VHVGVYWCMRKKEVDILSPLLTPDRNSIVDPRKVTMLYVVRRLREFVHRIVHVRDMSQ